jgi:4-hydroxymandelate oxidase
MSKPPLQAIPRDIICAVDYERHAVDYVEHSAWEYLQGGAADEYTVKANLASWRHYDICPRVLADVRGGHTRCTLLGETLTHPIILAPVASQRLFHAQGELASVLAAGVMGGLAVVSTQASFGMDAIASNAQGPLWFQLYWQGSRDATLALIQRAEAAGYRAFVFTVDAPLSGARNREQRAGFSLPPDMAHINAQPIQLPTIKENMSAIFDGLMAIAPTWDDMQWLTEQTSLPILLKGILHPDDASKAVDIGAAGIVVSNHGGRVLVDGGIRRGTDILKARALGATAVMIGRPYIYALATAGALGVAHLIRVLREELEIAMALSGCKTLDDIHSSMLTTGNTQ